MWTILKMDVNTTDPYEQKLYNMFKSFDIQSMGSLDKSALLELCTTLELKDRSAKLVANLIDPKRNNRVTFNEFKGLKWLNYRNNTFLTL